MVWSTKKIGFFLAIMEYIGNLEGFLAMPKSQTTFSAPTSNYCHNYYQCDNLIGDRIDDLSKVGIAISK